MSEGNVVPAGFRPSTAPPSGADYGDSPLRDFWGRGSGFSVRGGVGAKGRAWQRVGFQFTELQVLETDGSVYPFPTAEISIFYSDPAQTPKRREGQGTNDWEALCESMRDLYGDSPDAIDNLFGGQTFGEGSQPPKPGTWQHWTKVPTLLRVGPNDSNNTWHDETVLAWKVVEVDGVASTGGGTTPAGTPAPTQQGNALVDHVLDLAEGKTEEAFYAAALDDSTVLATPSIVTPITDRTFIANMVQLGKLTKDSNGLLHRVS